MKPALHEYDFVSRTMIRFSELGLTLLAECKLSRDLGHKLALNLRGKQWAQALQQGCSYQIKARLSAILHFVYRDRQNAITSGCKLTCLLR